MSKLGITCVAIALAAMLAVPAIVFAAAPVATGTVDYQLWMEGQPREAIVIVTVTLSPSTVLPATVRIPVPTGMTVDWAGEIKGDDPAGDVERPFQLKDGEGGSYAEFEVSESREAQIDTSGKQLNMRGTNVSADFVLVQTVPAEKTSLSVRIPPGASGVKTDPALLGKSAVNQAGEALYTLASPDLKVGESVNVGVSYSTVAATAPSGSADLGGLTGLLIALGVLIVVAVAALIYAIQRQGSVR